MQRGGGVHLLARKALEGLETAQKFEPKVPQLHFLLGLAYGQIGKLDQSQSSFEQAIAYDPKFIKAYLALGEMMLTTDPVAVPCRFR